MTHTHSIVWLRADLRLADNPALSAALRAGPATALYIHETDPGLRPIGAAARWWLHQSLETLGRNLAAIGVPLLVKTGRAAEMVAATARDSNSTAVYWNRRYGPAERDLDAAIKLDLRQRGVTVQSFAANLLIEPWALQTGQGKPYSVFTPFNRALRQQTIALPLPAPTGGAPIEVAPVDPDYNPPRWAEKFTPLWRVGEAAAADAVAAFFDHHLTAYPDGRDYPGRGNTSRLSPHLRFGEISARQIWHAAQALALRHNELQTPVDKFLAELAWRDFNYHQLFHRSDIASIPMQPKYETMAWRHSLPDLHRWQSGQTGLPIVDAGMRELWATGFLQNRVRMLTASLLVKNLLLDWRRGENWFWDCLVDADLASNPGNWQWVAGCGLDASPYFRIFNPVVQGERFDATGDYVRRWLPELARLPDKWIHQPFAAPADVLIDANVDLGTTYPLPIVDLKHSRERALAAAKALQQHFPSTSRSPAGTIDME